MSRYSLILQREINQQAKLKFVGFPLDPRWVLLPTHQIKQLSLWGLKLFTIIMWNIACTCLVTLYGIPIRTERHILCYLLQNQ